MRYRACLPEANGKPTSLLQLVKCNLSFWRRGSSAGGQHFVVPTAARLVRFLRSDHDDRVIQCSRWLDHLTRRCVRLAASPQIDTNRMQLDHFFRDAQKMRHGAEGLAAEVGIQPGDDHAKIPNSSDQALARLLHYAVVKKLSFVNRDDGGLAICQLENVGLTLRHRNTASTD